MSVELVFGCAGRAISFLFVERVDLHPVVIPHLFHFQVSEVSGRVTQLQALLAYVPNCKLFLRKIGAIFTISVY